MPNPSLDIGSATVSDMKNAVPDYSVDPRQTDAATGQDETSWINTKASQYLGYYKTIPELKKAIDALATWCVGKGFEADNHTTAILDHWMGWGEDTAQSIFWNLMVQKKVYGDCFAEAIWNEDLHLVVNLKPLDPASMKVIVNKQGILKRYEQISKNPDQKPKKFEPHQIFHSCNDRVVDEIHGTSACEACENVILMRNEALADWKKVLHRNICPLKIVYLESDTDAEITVFKTKFETMVKDKEVLFVPMGSAKVEIPSVALQDPIAWIRYLENFFYQAVGVPKVILGGSEEFTESSSKIAYMTWDQIYLRDQREFEADLWNQLQIKIKFIQPASLHNEMLTDESKDNQPTAFQPAELSAGGVR